MAKQSSTTLKGYFNTGDKPTESQFSDTVDSFLNLSVTGTEAHAGSLTLNAVSQSFTLSGSEAYSKIVFSNLPAGDPGVAGQLWNSSGTLKVSSG